MAKVKKKWYAIKAIDGKELNKIVTTWADCKKIVDHHAAVYKSFLSEEEAVSYLKGMTKDKQDKYVEQMKYGREKKKVLKETTKSFNFRVPNEIYDQFVDKAKSMGWKEEDVVLDLIKDWIGIGD